MSPNVQTGLLTYFLTAGRSASVTADPSVTLFGWMVDFGDVVPDGPGSSQRKVQIGPVGRNIVAGSAFVALSGHSVCCQRCSIPGAFGPALLSIGQGDPQGGGEL